MRRVVLYGNSLVVSAFGASLEECGDLELVRVDAGPADAAARLCALEPAAVVFDRVTTRPDFAMALLDQHPQVLLIGVDPSNDRILVLSGREEQPASAADLVQIIARGHSGVDDRPGDGSLQGEGSVIRLEEEY
jgi:hypothetical protein